MLMWQFEGCLKIGQNCYVGWLGEMVFGGNIKYTMWKERREKWVGKLWAHWNQGEHKKLLAGFPSKYIS